jgi:predicted HicB family RNase H-like nuclease
MARHRRVRKASEKGEPKTLWLRRGVVRRADREARKQDVSLSEYVNTVLTEKLDSIDAAPAQQAA